MKKAGPGGKEEGTNSRPQVMRQRTYGEGSGETHKEVGREIKRKWGAMTVKGGVSVYHTHIPAKRL